MADAVFWIFKDASVEEPRVFATDPTSLLPNHVEVPLEVADGVLFDTIVKQGGQFLQSMRGVQGDEAFLKVTIKSNGPAALQAIIDANTPPEG